MTLHIFISHFVTFDLYFLLNGPRAHFILKLISPQDI